MCVKIGSGATPRGGKEVYLSSGVSLIRSQNVYNDGFHTEGLVFISDDHADQLAGVTVDAGDVLLNITGDSVARACQVPSNILPARVNQHVAIIRPDACQLDARYLRYYLISDQMQAHMLRLASAGATRNALTKGMIEDFQIPWRPLPEQRAIAHILGTLDDKIELNRRMNATLEEMARALFKSWFVDFDPVRAKAAGRQPAGMDAATAALFPDSFEESELGQIPRGWRVGSLGDIVKINARSIGKRYDLDVIEYVDISSVTEGRLDGTTPYSLIEAPSRAKRLVQAGDTIWSMVRPNRRSFLYIHQPADNLVVSTGFAVLTPTIPSPGFVYAAVTTNGFVDYLTSNADGSAYPAVRPEHFERTAMLIPGDEILLAFERLIAPLRSMVASNEQQNRALAATRDELLPKLLSGGLLVS